LYDRLQGNGFELITILHLPSPGQPHPSSVADALQAPIALQEDTGDVGQAYHVEQYPSLFLLDAGGRVVWCAEGSHRRDLTALRQALARLGLQ
jgi:hypothetical protein